MNQSCIDRKAGFTAAQTPAAVELLVDIKSVLYESRRTNLVDVSIGNVFESLLRAGSRNGVRNPGEFVLLTRTFVILESMISQRAPGYKHMESFREEISRLRAQHFSLARIKGTTTRLAREMERLIIDARGDTRRILRRFAKDNLGRLTGAIAFAALVIGGSVPLMTPMGSWHDTLGALMIIGGFIGIITIYIRALRRDPDQG